jgi:subtilisin family serine protease
MRRHSFRHQLTFFLLLAGLLPASALAAAPGDPGVSRYLVFLAEPPLAQSGHLDKAARTEKLDSLRASHRLVWQKISPAKAQTAFRHEYFYASNGFAADLTEKQVAALRKDPAVKSVIARTESHLLTDAGPRWIGADQVWDGQTTAGAHRGEGVVIGIIDGGINPDHPSFAATASDGYSHSNPYGSFKGLCASNPARCNNKLVGIYDFTDEGTQGIDGNGHGTHVASTAVGNPLTAPFQGITYQVSGVAPRANIISYKACVKDNPNTPEENDDVCFSDDLLAAIDQSVADGVDIVNYSIGGTTPCTPWPNAGLSFCAQYGSDGEAQAMLNARAAGVLYVVAAGNEGPGDGTIDYPGLAPWVLTVGNLTHDRRVASNLQDFSGGEITMPESLAGVSLTEGIGPRRIVHARDYGFPLCGTGTPELKTGCNPGDPESLTGASNPFLPNTFNGEIVVCDRGTYGRVEKGYNVKLAGAGGYVLANTSGQAESIVADAHCLPATHVGNQAGTLLRQWLATGSNHKARIQGQTLEYNPDFGDIMNASSSRGPVEIIHATASSAPDVRHRVNYMKPDIAAPGTSILAASAFDNGLRSLTGTSMATPHVAGAAALIKSAHPQYGPSELISALVLTAQSETVRKEDQSTPAQARDRGAGRARVDRALDQPLVLLETRNGFLNGNPQAGGEPEQMNLPFLYSGHCEGSCQFSRTFTNRSGQTLSWQAHLETDNGLSVQISPQQFTLAAGQSQTVTFSIDTSAGDVLGHWSEARVVFLPNDAALAPASLPVAVFASAGEFPQQWRYSSARRADRFMIELTDVAPMTQAAFAGWGPVQPEAFSGPVEPDSTAGDAFDGNGTLFQVFPLNQAKKLLMVQATSESGTANVELFVGRDADIDDSPDENEILCEARGSMPNKSCVIPNPTLGHYWVMVRNRGNSNQTIGALAAFLGPDDGPQTPLLGDGDAAGANPPRDGRAVHVLGPAAFPDGQGRLQVSYQLPVISKAMQSTQTFFGAVAIGGNPASVGETAMIPLFIKQTGPYVFKPYSLNNEIADSSMPNDSNRRLVGFIDAGSGAQSLSVNVAFLQSMQVNLYRHDFDFDPLNLMPDLSAETPTLNSGPMVQIIDVDERYALQTYEADISAYPPGRWYVEILQGDGSPGGNGAASNQENPIRVAASIDYDQQSVITPQQSVWYNPQRDGWGADLAFSSDFQAITWYRYDQDNQPTWYQGAAPVAAGSNNWRAPLLHYTWDGVIARPGEVGNVAMTYTSERTGILTFALDDKTYSEPVTAILEAHPPCPVLDGQTLDVTGHWYAPDQPGYGSTTFVRSTREDLLYYLYDAYGMPRWAMGYGEVPASKNDRNMPLHQAVEGFCPDCAATPIEFVTIGTVTTSYFDDNHGHLAADLDLNPPLLGHWSRSQNSLKLSRNFQCQQ